MIKKFPYSSLSPEAMITLATESITTITTNHPDEAAFSKSITRLSNAKDEAQKGIGKTTKEALTAAVTLADAKRDDNYRGIRDHIEAGLKRHSNPLYQQACKRLDSILIKHGKNLIKSSYPVESSRLNKLFKDLETKQAIADLQIAHLTDWLSELKTDQIAFEKVFIERNKQKATKDTLTDDQTRKILTDALQKFYIVIDAAFIDETVAGVDVSINQINITIDRIVASAK